VCGSHVETCTYVPKLLKHMVIFSKNFLLLDAMSPINFYSLPSTIWILLLPKFLRH